MKIHHTIIGRQYLIAYSLRRAIVEELLSVWAMKPVIREPIQIARQSRHDYDKRAEVLRDSSYFSLCSHHPVCARVQLYKFI